MAALHVPFNWVVLAYFDKGKHVRTLYASRVATAREKHFFFQSGNFALNQLKKTQDPTSNFVKLKMYMY